MSTVEAKKEVSQAPAPSSEKDVILVDRVAAAIEAANVPDREGPYGLYDYSQYGYDEPYRVRDFRDLDSPTYGDTVFRSSDRRAARQEFEKLTRCHVAMAAIESISGGSIRG